LPGRKLSKPFRKVRSSSLSFQPATRLRSLNIDEGAKRIRVAEMEIREFTSAREGPALGDGG